MTPRASRLTDRTPTGRRMIAVIATMAMLMSMLVALAAPSANAQAAVRIEDATARDVIVRSLTQLYQHA